MKNLLTLTLLLAIGNQLFAQTFFQVGASYPTKGQQTTIVSAPPSVSITPTCSGGLCMVVAPAKTETTTTRAVYSQLTLGTVFNKVDIEGSVKFSLDLGLAQKYYPVYYSFAAGYKISIGGSDEYYDRDISITPLVHYNYVHVSNYDKTENYRNVGVSLRFNYQPIEHVQLLQLYGEPELIDNHVFINGGVLIKFAGRK